ncbi:MAG: alpha/beta hydrolase [Chloroflexaceae bacterium]|nr:alpha/beta hydrolase [Chloroflexaceae bacterium]
MKPKSGVARNKPGSGQRFPSLDHVWVWTAVVLIALRPLLIPIPPHDFWWQMATGRWTIAHGAIPTVDMFSYTRYGEPFFNQPWLAQVLLYGMYQLGGVALILIAQSLVLVLAYGLLLVLCVRRSGALRLSVAMLLLTAMLLGFDNWNVRPQTYAFPLFVAFLLILTAWRLPSLRLPAPLWLLPLLMIVWVNLHGSFVLGGLLMALTFVGEALRRWLQALTPGPAPICAVGAQHAAPSQEESGQADAALPLRPLRSLFLWGVVTAAALLVNPNGLGIVGYVTNLTSNSAVTTLVTEWAAPTTDTVDGAIFFLYLMAAVVVLAYARRPPDPLDLVLVAPLLWLSLGAGRNIVWLSFVLLPLLVVQAAPWLQPPPGAPRRPAAEVYSLNWLLIGMMGLLLLLGLPWVKPMLALPSDLNRLVSVDTPVEAVQAMQAQPDGERPQHLFHALGYGSYLIWAAPEQPVFIDPRIELYPYEQWQDYILLSAGQNAEQLLQSYQIDGLLLDHERQEGLLELVRDDPQWQVRYEDEQTTYLIRR